MNSVLKTLLILMKHYFCRAHPHFNDVIYCVDAKRDDVGFVYMIIHDLITNTVYIDPEMIFNRSSEEIKEIFSELSKHANVIIRHLSTLIFEL